MNRGMSWRLRGAFVLGLVLMMLAGAKASAASALTPGRDPSFGTGGPGTTALASAARGAAVQSTGASLVLGDGTAMVQRLTTTGGLDASFTAPAPPTPPANYSLRVTGITLGAADSFYVAGFFVPSAGAGTWKVWAEHFNADGTADTSYGTPTGDTGVADSGQLTGGRVTMLSGGAVVVAFGSIASGGTYAGGLMRFAAGTPAAPDAAFGNGGASLPGLESYPDGGGGARFDDVVAQGSNVIVAGRSGDATGDMAMWRFNGSTGAVDTTFDANATKVTLPFTNGSVRVAQSTGGSILVGGAGTPSSGSSPPPALFVDDFNADGTPVSAFNGGAAQSFALPASGDSATAVGVGQVGGDAVVAASVGASGTSVDLMLAGASLTDGSADAAIGAGGEYVDSTQPFPADGAVFAGSSTAPNVLFVGPDAGASSGVARRYQFGAQTQFTIVNSAQTPQYSLYIVEPSGAPAPVAGDWHTAYVNGQATSTPGTLTLTLTPGQTVYFQRTSDPVDTAQDGPLTTPEGASGQSYVVPDPAPSSATVTLPTTTTNGVTGAYHPELSSAERWMVGQLNERRTAAGNQPLSISTTLSAAASEEARDEAVNHRWPHPYFYVVPQDFGWPGDAYFDLSQADAPFSDPERVLTHWDGDPSDSESAAIWQQLNDSSMKYVGIADAGGAWIIYVADQCPGNDTGACGITSDQGDSGAWAPTQISINAPAEGANYIQGQAVSASYACTAPSGNGVTVASCSGPVTSGEGVDTNTLGTHTFTVTATDINGDTTSKTVTYTVQPAGGGPTVHPGTSLLLASFDTEDGSARAFAASGAPHYAAGDYVGLNGACGDGGFGLRSCEFVDTAADGSQTTLPIANLLGSWYCFGCRLAHPAVGLHNIALRARYGSSGYQVELWGQYVVDPPAQPAQVDHSAQGSLNSQLPALNAGVTGAAAGATPAIDLLDGGGAVAKIISDAGTGVVSQGASNVINAGAGNLVPPPGGSLISDKGLGVISRDGAGAADFSARAASGRAVSAAGASLFTLRDARDRIVAVVSVAAGQVTVIATSSALARGSGLVVPAAAPVIAQGRGTITGGAIRITRLQAKKGASLRRSKAPAVPVTAALSGKLTATVLSGTGRRAVRVATGTATLAYRGQRTTMVLNLTGAGRRLLSALTRSNARLIAAHRRPRSQTLVLQERLVPLVGMAVTVRARFRVTPRPGAKRK